MKIKKISERLIHKPVLVREVLEGLGFGNNAHLKKSGKYIDATLGHAGHSLEIVKRSGSVLCIDADPEALEVAKERLRLACPPTFISQKCGFYKLVLDNFVNIDSIATENGFDQVDGILFDLGVSGYQLTSPIRGFSFSNPDAGLDMRFNKDSQEIKASDLLNLLRKDQLEELFSAVLGKKDSQVLSSAVVRERELRKFNKVGDLLRVVNGVFGQVGPHHPATKAFLALRMTVNSELENIETSLPKAFNLLKPNGRLLVISFHSVEDALVKSLFQKLVLSAGAKLVNKKPIVPSRGEILKNPRSRSAKLRIVSKI